MAVEKCVCMYECTLLDLYAELMVLSLGFLGLEKCEFMLNPEKKKTGIRSVHTCKPISTQTCKYVSIKTNQRNYMLE